MLWRDVPGFPDYEVSEHGNLRRGSNYLKPHRIHGSGRKRFSLSKDGRKHHFHAARLVVLAFVGPKPFDGAEICHNDGFLHNNHYSNLRWDTHAWNVADAAKHRLRHRENLGRAEKKHWIDAATSAFLAENSH